MDERERAIRALLPLVKRIASRIRAVVPGVDYYDLVGDGSIGAIRAVDGFDPARGTSLETYARRVILGHILNGLRRMDPIPERTRREIRDAERQRYALALLRQSVPSISEMCDLRPKFRDAYDRTRTFMMLSLDAPLPDNIDPPLDFQSNPLAVIVRNAEQRWLQRVLAALPRRQQFVIHRHYFSDMAIHTIAAMLAVSPQRASQLHRDAIQSLRKMQLSTGSTL